MWTIHALASEWPQCDCPLATQGIVCKHVMEVFKMLHPNIRDGSIVREIGALHGVAQGGVILEHNSLDYGIGDNDTKDDDPINKQLGQNNGLELKDHLESTIDEDVIDVIDKVFSNLRATTMEFPTLQMHLLSASRILRGKQENMLMQGVANLAHLATTILFPYTIGDNALKRHRGLLKPPTHKHNHLKDRTRKHRRI